MAREKMFDPQFQKVFTEAINKENKIRMKWHLEYGSRIARHNAVEWDEESSEEEEPPTPTSGKKEEPWYIPDYEGDTLARSGPVEARKASRVEDVPWPGPSGSGTGGITRIADPPPLMKPVKPDTKLLLYQGISHDDEGRAQYLKTRNRCDPEDKYTFPVVSSWEYGWKYGHPQEELTCPDHGRCNIIKQSFYRPNDTQIKPREDDYY